MRPPPPQIVPLSLKCGLSDEVLFLTEASVDLGQTWRPNHNISSLPEKYEIQKKSKRWRKYEKCHLTVNIHHKGFYIIGLNCWY